MKQIIYILSILCIVLVSCNSKNGHEDHSQHESAEKKIYTCPMHPDIIRDQPGQCPICGMDLVEKKSEGESIRDTSLVFLLKPTNQYVLSKIKTIHPTQKEMSTEIKVTGVIEYDSRMVRTVSTRVSGRIEKLYVKYTYQPISVGTKLMDIYSKDLVTEEENYLFILKNDSENNSLIKAAENKLELLGLNKEQITELKSSGKIIYSIPVYSPYSGHLHDIMPKKSDGMSSSMQNMQLTIHEGMYAKKGESIFNIYSTDKVWAVLNVHSDKQGGIKKGQAVDLNIDGVDDPIAAKIDFIEPLVRADQKTISIRAYLDNPDGKLKISANVKAVISGSKTNAVFIPADAVISLGMNQVVLIKKEKLFEVTPVQLGVKTDGWIEVLSGIEPNAELAENAQFLMDSESFVKTKNQ